MISSWRSIRQEELERGQQSGVEACSVRMGQTQDGLAQSLVHLEPQHGAFGRSGSAAWENPRGCRARADRQQAAGSSTASVARPRLRRGPGLPGREVRVAGRFEIERPAFPLGRIEPAFPLGRIEPAELVDEHRKRPEVGDDVVEDDQQNVIVRRAAQEVDPEERSLLQVKGPRKDP